MKANELMIGDLVYVSPSMMAIKVVAVHEGWVRYCSCTGRMMRVKEELLVPIPVTQELLEKNGFSIQYKSQYLKDFELVLPRENDECDYFCVRLDESACSGRINYHPIDKIDRITFAANPLYIHHLQHALRTVRIDKEIEL